MRSLVSSKAQAEDLEGGGRRQEAGDRRQEARSKELDVM